MRGSRPPRRPRALRSPAAQRAVVIASAALIAAAVLSFVGSSQPRLGGTHRYRLSIGPGESSSVRLYHHWGLDRPLKEVVTGMGALESRMEGKAQYVSGASGAGKPQSAPSSEAEDAIVKDSDFAEQESWLEQVVADVSSHYESSRSTGQQGGRASKTKEFGASDQMVEALLRSRKQNRTTNMLKERKYLKVGRNPKFGIWWSKQQERSRDLHPKCGGMPVEFAAEFRKEKLPPMKTRMYRSSIGVATYRGVTGYVGIDEEGAFKRAGLMCKTEGGLRAASKATNLQRLRKGEVALLGCLLDFGECGREARAAALSVRGMQEALHGVEKALQMHHTSCAVVGNSGGLLEHNYGKFIDNHDFVMRVNHRKLDGWIAHTGHKTDARFLGYQHSKELCCIPEARRYHSRTTAIDHPETPFYLWHPVEKTKIARQLKRDMPTREVYAVMQSFINASILVYKAMRGELQRLGFGPFTDWEFMSSGMHALLAALRQCDAVDVYGFTSTSLHSSRHNYDGPDKPTPVKSDTFHSWDGERMILRLLHAAGAINICST